MQGTDFIRAVWEAASELGLTSQWQFWALMLLVFGVVVLHKLRPVSVPKDSEGIPLDSKAPPIDMPEGGAVLDQKPDPDVATKG